MGISVFLSFDGSNWVEETTDIGELALASSVCQGVLNISISFLSECAQATIAKFPIYWKLQKSALGKIIKLQNQKQHHNFWCIWTWIMEVPKAQNMKPPKYKPPNICSPYSLTQSSFLVHIANIFMSTNMIANSNQSQVNQRYK